MPAINTVGICSKPNSERAGAVAPQLAEWLRARGIAIRADEATASYAPQSLDGMPREQVPEGCDLIIVLGGDGTLLSSRARHRKTRDPAVSGKHGRPRLSDGDQRG